MCFSGCDNLKQYQDKICRVLKQQLEIDPEFLSKVIIGAMINLSKKCCKVKEPHITLEHCRFTLLILKM